jgi:hypothetical protein
MVRRLQQDLPELLSFFAFPRHLWRKLRTTNVIDAASSKFGDALVPWCALSMSRAWTASSTPFSRDLTWNGKPAPSTYLHKQLDVTCKPGRLTKARRGGILFAILFKSFSDLLRSDALCPHC